ncbi:uncharacterized protein LOC115377120 isoform X2 [Myripristis murdjan]|uniref:uncharacterized protein LOC115377120 isoform X2 n=1 Tax=Myripristis murdjan TaxID=586833 RepID=UPI0011763FE3|nr:uncharacterized protein LOC115377120 isoform X2 [Myripristis murdjan]
MKHVESSWSSTEMGVRHLIYCLLLLRQTHTVFTGKAESQISASVQRSADRLTVSCSLLGTGTVTQVNWMMNRGTHSIRLGTYSPQYGVYIYPQFNDSVVIEGDAAERSSQVHLVESDVEEEGDGEVCCVFNVFPSGVLETCTVTTTTENQEADAFNDAQIELTGGRTLVQWCILVGGCTVFLISIITCLYYCWRFCCRFCCKRRKVYQVHTCHSDSGAEAEENTQASSQNQPPPAAEPNQPQPQAKGFDPSRLYAKIKFDLLYGRIWKAYQGSSRAWAPAPPQQETPQKVYSLLGEHGPAQFMETPVDSCSMTPQPDPSSQFAHDADLPQGLSSPVQSFPNLHHSPEQTASQPERLTLPFKPEFEQDSNPDSISESDPAQKT